MLRIEVREDGQGALPPIDIDDETFVIGSAVDARVRLPEESARPQHIVVRRGRWEARGEVAVDGGAREGEIGDGVALVVGRYRVRIGPAPAGVAPSPPQRTESLARELARQLLGTQGAPTLVVESGPVTGARCMLAPPESTLVIGRGDEAGWILLDEDLSRTHAEIRRGWDGTRVVDLGSKNGTRVDGVEVGREGVALRDGAVIELGKVTLRFTDPADRKVSTSVATPAAIRAAAPAPASPPTVAERPSTLPFYGALGVCVAALGGLVWILSR